eukprot:6194887-Pleurochrysis_carterae.AAC.1
MTVRLVCWWSLVGLKLVPDATLAHGQARGLAGAPATLARGRPGRDRATSSLRCHGNLPSASVPFMISPLYLSARSI